MAKVLVTGAGGFLAQYVLSEIRNRGYQIVTLVRRQSSTAISGEVQYESVEQLVRQEKHFDIIYHLAAHIPKGKGDVADPELTSSNIHLTSHLCLNYPDARMVYASSVSVFGEPLALPLTISSPNINPGHYGLSKLAGEACVANLKAYAIIRFSSIIGPGMTQATFVNYVVRGARQGVIKVYGQGKRKQNYIDVRDAAQLCMQAAENENNLLLLGVSLQSVSNLEVANLAAGLTGAQVELTGEDNSPSYIYDVGKSYDDLHFSPRHSLRETLQSMINQ